MRRLIIHHLPLLLRLLVLCQLAAHRAASASSDYVVSATASSDITVENELLQFDPANVSSVLDAAPYPQYESTLFSAFDAINERWFLLQEGCLIDVYAPSNLTLLRSIDYCSAVNIQFPAAMHFEAETDSLWLLWTQIGDVGNQWCSIPATAPAERNGTECFPFDAATSNLGYLQYTPDASAFDGRNRVAWAQVQVVQQTAQQTAQRTGGASGTYLVGFNTATREYLPTVPMRELCQHFQVAYLSANATSSALLCNLFTSHQIAAIDVSSGGVERVVARLPALAFPVVHTSVVRQRSGEAASYYLQLKGTERYVWQEWDVGTGTVLSNSSYPIHGRLPLAMPAYVAAARS